MVLAVLLSFALGPLVLLLRRWRRGRVPAVIVAVLLAFSMIGGIGTFVGTQLAHLAAELPGYQTNISQKIHSLRDSTGKGGVVDRTSKMVKNLGKEIEKPAETGERTAADQPVAPPPDAKQQSPVPVEVRQAATTPLQLIYGARQFYQPALPRPAITAQIAESDNRRRVLDPEDG
jgi:hypothetical protein